MTTDRERAREVPVPVAGSPQQVRLWVEVLTGKELDGLGTAPPLDRAERERRQRLESFVIRVLLRARGFGRLLLVTDDE